MNKCGKMSREDNMEERKVFHKPTFDNISSEKKDKILAVALNEFATKGYESANINTIAKRSGVSVGSLYKYFDSKSDLFLTTVHHGISALEAVLSEISSSDDDVMVKLEKLIRTAVDYSRKQSDLIKFYNEITAESNADLVRTISKKLESISAKVYIETIVRGQENGEIRKDIDPRMAAFLLDNLIMVIQFTYTCDYYSERFKTFAGDDVFENDEVAIESFLKFVKSALGANSKPENK